MEGMTFAKALILIPILAKADYLACTFKFHHHLTLFIIRLQHLSNKRWD